MAKFKVVLTLISEMGLPVGPRFRRGTPLPMERLYEERKGYYFEPEELELANECARKFEKYLDQSEKKKGKK
jgi:hypothetical protein